MFHNRLKFGKMPSKYLTCMKIVKNGFGEFDHRDTLINRSTKG